MSSTPCGPLRASATTRGRPHARRGDPQTLEKPVGPLSPSRPHDLRTGVAGRCAVSTAVMHLLCSSHGRVSWGTGVPRRRSTAAAGCWRCQPPWRHGCAQAAGRSRAPLARKTQTMRGVLYRQTRTHVNGVSRRHASAPSCRPAAGGAVVSTWMVLSHRCTRGRACGPTSPCPCGKPSAMGGVRLLAGGWRSASGPCIPMPHGGQ